MPALLEYRVLLEWPLSSFSKKKFYQIQKTNSILLISNSAALPHTVYACVYKIALRSPHDIAYFKQALRKMQRNAENAFVNLEFKRVFRNVFKRPVRVICLQTVSNVLKTIERFISNKLFK